VTPEALRQADQVEGKSTAHDLVKELIKKPSVSRSQIEKLENLFFQHVEILDEWILPEHQVQLSGLVGTIPLVVGYQAAPTLAEAVAIDKEFSRFFVKTVVPQGHPFAGVDLCVKFLDQISDQVETVHPDRNRPVFTIEFLVQDVVPNIAQIPRHTPHLAEIAPLLRLDNQSPCGLAVLAAHRRDRDSQIQIEQHEPHTTLAAPAATLALGKVLVDAEVDGRVLLRRSDPPERQQAAERRLGNIHSEEAKEQPPDLEVVVVFLETKVLDDVEDRWADLARKVGALEHSESKAPALTALVQAVETHPGNSDQDPAVQATKALYLLDSTLFGMPGSSPTAGTSAKSRRLYLDDPGVASLFYNPLGKRRMDSMKIEEIMVPHGRPPLVKWVCGYFHLTLLRGPANSLIHTFSKIEDSHDRAELRHGLRSIVGLTLGIEEGRLQSRV